MPPGITPPLILSFNASSVPILQLALSSDQMSETQIFDSALNFIRPALAPVPGAALPLPSAARLRQVQADLNQQALHQYGVSANDVINALSLQNLITPVGTQKNRQLRIYRQPERFAESGRSLQRSPDQRPLTAPLSICVTSPTCMMAVPADQRRPCQRRQRRAADRHEGRGASSTLDIINGVKSLLPSGIARRCRAA